MKLLPGSLIWRSFLLIAALMLLSVLTWFFIFTQYEREPRARQLSQLIVSVVNLTRTALIAARPEARMDLLRELSDREGIHLYPAEDDDRVAELPDRALLRRVQELLREAMGPATRLTMEREGENALFVSFTIDDEAYWVALPRERAADFPRARVNLSELREQQVLLLEEGHCMRTQALSLCELGGASERGGFRATSLETLRHLSEEGVVTKSGLMVGLGENDDEVLQTLRDLREAGVRIVTLGQYLRPTLEHYPVAAYITPEKFEWYRLRALEMGFSYCASAPLVRSSYMAEEALRSVKGLQR